MWKPSVTPSDVIRQSAISSDELYHHGIMGMHWGEQNGPPYPIAPGDHSAEEKRQMRKAARREKAEARKAKKRQKHEIKAQKKAEKAEEQRKEILRKGDAKQVAKLKGRISNEEYNEVFRRLENEAKLDALTSSQMKEISAKIGAAKNAINNLKQATDAAIGLYNNSANVYNTYQSAKGTAKRWRTVPQKDKEKDKK